MSSGAKENAGHPCGAPPSADRAATASTLPREPKRPRAGTAPESPGAAGVAPARRRSLSESTHSPGGDGYYDPLVRALVADALRFAEEARDAALDDKENWRRGQGK